MVMSLIKYLSVLMCLCLVGCSVKPVKIDFNHLEKIDKPNRYLLCDPKFCNLTPDEKSECFSISAEGLKEKVIQLIQNKPRYTQLSDDGNQVQYVQRSLIFRFPDILTIQFYELSKSTSTLAILSYAQYGYYDFGVNKDRVTSLVNSLKKSVALCNQSNSNK